MRKFLLNSLVLMVIRGLPGCILKVLLEASAQYVAVREAAEAPGWKDGELNDKWLQIRGISWGFSLR